MTTRRSFEHIDPGVVFANIPGILGHHPTEEIILLTAIDRRSPGPHHPEAGSAGLLSAAGHLAPGPLMARSLDGVTHPAVVEMTVAELSAQGVVAAEIYLVLGVGDLRDRLPALRRTVGLLQRWLATEAIACEVAFATDRVATDREYLDVEDAAVVGRISDVEGAWATRRAVAADEEIAGDRGQLEARFAKLTTAQCPDLAGVRERIAVAAAENRRRLAGARRSELGVALADMASAAGQVVAAVDAGQIRAQELCGDEAALAVVAAALGMPMARDLLFSLTRSPMRAAARAVWESSARALEGVERSNALALYAVDRFHAGAGGVGLVALQAALAEVPDHNLSLLLTAAVYGNQIDECLQVLFGTSGGILEELCGDDGRAA